MIQAYLHFKVFEFACQRLKMIEMMFTYEYIIESENEDMHV